MRLLRLLSVVAAGMLLSHAASAQLSGTINVPGAYPDLGSAITALNAQGVGAGGVTLNLTGGNPQTAPAGGYVITATGTAANPIIFQGNANVITANAALTAGSTTDAIFTIGGGDYITLNNFVMQENAANITTAAATNNMTEFGVVIARAAAADGAKNNTISNNTITLRATGAAYTNTIGIYMSARHNYNASFTTSVSNAAGGENSNNTFAGNTISGVTSGIVIIGDGTNNDAGNVIGGAAAQANTITLATSSAGVTTAYTGYSTSRMDGIYLLGNQILTVSYNTVTLANGSTPTANGIFTSTAVNGTYTNSLSNNTVSLTGTGSNQYAGIQSGAGGSSTTTNLNNNNVTVNNGGTTYGIYNSVAQATLNMNNNTVDVGNTSTANTTSTISWLYNGSTIGTLLNIQNNTIKSTAGLTTTSGTVNLIYNSSSTTTANVTGNQTTGTLTKSGSGGTVYFYYNNGGPGAGLETVSNNNFSNISTSGTTAVAGIWVNSSTSNNKAYNNNIINNIACGSGSSSMMMLNYFNPASVANNNKITNITATGSLYPISFSSSSLASTGTSTGGTLIGNRVSNVTTSGASATLVGIAIYPSSGAVKVTADTVNGLSVTGNTLPVLRGIQVATGTNDSVYQNVINGLSATTTTGSAVVTGITVSGSTTPYVFRNNIYSLTTGTSAGTSTQVSGIAISGGTTAVNVYNNFISGLTAPSASNASAVVGINITGTSVTHRLYYNTIYIGSGGALTSSGTNFGATGILFPSSTTTLTDVKNSIINVNAVPTGTGLTAAVRRNTSAATAGTPPTATNFSGGYNVYWVPTGANYYLYVDATDNTNAKNGYNTSGLTADAVNNIVNDPGFNTPCSQFKTFMAGRETGTFRENNLVAGALTGTFAPSGSSFAESSALPITTPAITDDYAGSLRGTTPDIGALQFTGSGVDATPPAIAYTALTSPSYCLTAPTLTANITDASGINTTAGTAPRLYYKKATEANAFGNYPADNISAFNGWKYVEGTGTGPAFTFTFDFSKLNTPLAIGDSITYFVVAQDLSAAVNVSAVIAGFPSGYCPTSVNLPPAAGPLTATPVMNGYKINPASTVTVLSSQSAICASGTTTLSLSPVPAGVAIQWQQDNGTSTFTDIPGATGTTYTTPVLTATNNFRAVFLCGSTPAGNTAAVSVVVNNPSVTGTTPASRCGAGTVTLAATTAAGNSLRWYASATGGAPLATGPSFTTPTINATTTYYVGAMSAGVNENGGKPAAAATSTTGFLTTPDWGIQFSATQAFTLNSVTIYPVGTGTVTIALVNSSSVELASTAAIPVTGTGPTTPVVVPLGFSVPVGTGYRLVLKAYSGITDLIRESSGNTFPYNSPSGALGVTAGWNGSSTTSYYWFYNFNISTGCEGTRTAVTATVTPAPAITAGTTTPGICSGNTATLTATSANSGYVYSWTPGSLTGSSVTVSPTATTKYYVTGNDPVSGCTALDSVNILVNTQPAAPVVSPLAVTICPGGSTQLTASAATVSTNAVIGTGTVTNSSTAFPAPVAHYYGGQRHQLLVPASELTAQGLVAGSQISSLSFNITALNSATASANLEINLGHAALAAMTQNGWVTGLTNVYTAASYQPVVGANIFTFTTPFTWNGTGNLIVELVSNNNDGGSGSNPSYSSTVTPAATVLYYRQDNAGAGNSAIITNSTLATAPGNGNAQGTTSTQRPNMTFSYGKPLPVRWQVTTGLFKDAALTQVVTATDTNTVVYAAPAATTGYTAVNTIQGCVSQPSTPAVVTVSQPVATITPSGPTTFCQGGSVLLNANTGTGFTYQWKVNGSVINGATTASYTANASGTYTVDVTNANNCMATATAVTVTVNAAPAATATAIGATTFCQGGSVVLNAPTGTGFTYQWLLNGNTITTGGTNASYTASVAGNYSVIVTNASGCPATSATVPVTVNPLPAASITAGSPTTFCQGGQVTLNGPAGTGLTYQWRLNGGNIAGATSASYIANAAGAYKVVVTNSNGCTDSSAATNVIVNPLPTATATAATATTFCQGGSVVINANTGTGLTYQWKLNGTNITTGGTGASYTANASGSYSVTVTNANGCSATSAAVSVTVNPLPSTTVTASGPTTFCQGGSVIFTAPAGNSYQWRLNGANIVGATTNTYTVSASGIYKVVVTNGSGCVDSSAATTVTVNPLPTATVTAGGATTFCQGGSVLLSAPTGTGLSYQWRLNGNAINGATAATYTANASGSYTVVVTSSASCQATSTAVSVTVNPAPTATVTASGPLSFCQGGSVTLTAPTAAGNTYQWRLNGANIAGATTNNYVATTSGTYKVVVTNATSCTDSSAASVVTVNPVPTATAAIVGNAAVCFGDSVKLVANTGTGLTYQWLLNGNAVTGATLDSFFATASGTYRVRVANSAGCFDTSAAVSVTVRPLPSATITPAGTVRICQGDSTTLLANTGSNFTYQWQLNGNNITAATNAGLTTATPGVYRVIVTDSFGCRATSVADTVLVNPLPIPVITSPAPGVMTTGTFATYQWNLAGQPVSGATGQTYNAAQNGVYTVTVTDSNGCKATSAPFTMDKVGIVSVPGTGSIRIFPNPTQGRVQVQADTKVDIYIYSLDGKLVQRAEQTNEVDMSQLADGMYTIKVTDRKGHSVIQKLTKATW